MDERTDQPRPYHVVPGPSAHNRILLISYHAPPSNEIGARRWASMARHFAERGWGLDILAVDPRVLESRNDSLLDELPAGTRLFGVPEPLPTIDRVVAGAVLARRQLIKRSRGSTAQPATAPEPPARRTPSAGRKVLNAFYSWREHAMQGAWARLAAETGRQVFDPERHRWVISSGPPFMTHDGGRLLAKWTGLPFVADFRDAWRFQEWVGFGRTWHWLATRYESRAVRRAAITVANVEPVRALMQRAYPLARVITITNGVDDDAIPTAPPPSRFVIGYPGTIYLGRDPEPVFEAVAVLVRSLGLTPKDLGLEFMGYFDPPIEARLRRLGVIHGLEPFLAIFPGRPRPLALEFVASCSVLVALQQGSDLTIPAKVFEFMRFPAHLLVLAGRGSATTELLAGNGADVIEPQDVASIAAALTKHFQEFKRGVRPLPLANQERFTRRYQAGRLLDEMELAVPTGKMPARQPPPG